MGCGNTEDHNAQYYNTEHHNTEHYNTEHINTKCINAETNPLPHYLRPVEAMQQRLRSISRVYRDISPGPVDGVFGAETTAAVRAFQHEFDLAESGNIDLATWDMIILVHGELESLRVGSGEFNLGLEPTCLMFHTTGAGDCVSNPAVVDLLQTVIDSFAGHFRNFTPVPTSGVYDEATAEQVAIFQNLAGLPQNGVLDRRTWTLMLRFFDAM